MTVKEVGFEQIKENLASEIKAMEIEAIDNTIVVSFCPSDVINLIFGDNFNVLVTTFQNLSPMYFVSNIPWWSDKISKLFTKTRIKLIQSTLG